MAEIRRRRPDARFFGMGGEALRAQGVETLYDATEISVMGIAEVLPRLWHILGVLRGLTRVAAERRPDAAILVDVPDFNLRLARRLKRLGIPVVQYVSPMVWAWREGRVRRMARDLSRVLCILPFEERFLVERGVKARYVGSPVLDALPDATPAPQARAALGLAERPTVALLPGSRRSEVERLFPTLLAAAQRLGAERPDLQFVVPVAPMLPISDLASLIDGSAVQPILVRGRTAEVIAAADAVVVASGTAVLETALLARPLVVVYRVSFLTWLVARLLLRVADVALVNILCGRRVVTELINRNLTPERLAAETRRLLDDAGARGSMLEAFGQMRAALGGRGAGARAADQVLAVVDGPEAP